MRRPELEFLPAVIEIERSPPGLPARALLWCIAALVAAATTWSCVGEVDIVATAPGKVVPADRVKAVQAMMSGRVRALHVVEGQAVAAGAVVIELDDSKARADLASLRGKWQRLDGEQRRLRALLAYLARPHGAADPTALPPDLQRHLEAEYAAFVATRAAMVEALARQRAERTGFEVDLARVEATLPLLTERAEARRTLAARALAPRAAWLELEELRLARGGERAVLHARIAVANAALDAATQRLAAHVAEAEARWRDALATVEGELASTVQLIAKARVLVDEHRLVAPVTGTVQELAVHTVGGVVGPAERLMLVVPAAPAVQVEAWIANKDVGFVSAGQDAVIKVDTFPFTRYGTLAARVATISPDATQHDTLGLVFRAQLNLRQSHLRVGREQQPLTPGMAVTVEMDMGKRRVIEYLLLPLLRYRDEGLTER